MNIFSKACIENDINKVRELYYGAKTPLFILDENNNSPLHLAISANNKDVVEFLIKKDLFITTKNNEGLTPIELTLKKNLPELFLFFIDKYDEEYLSAILNSVDCQKETKDIFKKLFNYNENVVYSDLSENILYIKDQDFEDIMYVLKNSIQSENYEKAKEIVFLLYKNHTDKIKDRIDEVIVELIVKENFDFTNLIKDIFNLKDLILSKEALSILFNKGTIDGINYLYNNFQQLELIKDNIFYIHRGSINVIDFLIKNYSLNLKKLSQESLMLANYDKDYLDFIKRKISLNNYDLLNLVVNLVNKNEENYNDYIVNLIKNNTEVFLLKDIDNSNFLMKIVNSKNYEIIAFVIEYFGFMQNEITSKGEIPLIYSVKNKDVDLFRIIATAESTNLNLFDKNINNVLHYLFSEEVIFGKDEKFDIILPYIDNDMLLLTNKEGKTPLYLLCENEKLEELKELILLGIINNDNVNYPSLGKTVGDFYELNYLNVQPHYKEEYKKIMTSENIEQGIIKNDIIYLSKVLAELDIKKARLNDVSYDSFMNKASSFECVLLLEQYGFNINGINPEEVETPLMKAVERKDIACSLYLISHGAEINTNIDINGEKQNALLLAYKNEDYAIIFNLLRSKIDVDVDFLNNTLYETWITYTLLPKENIIPIQFKKEIIKEGGLFDKTQKIAYKINKNDTDEIILKKTVLNIIEDVDNFKDLFKKCNKAKIKCEISYMKNKLFDVFFEKENLKLRLSDLGILREDFKNKLNYNYFTLNKLLKGKNK